MPAFGISQNFNFSENPYNPLNKPNTYKNIDNPNYWKNKKPYQDYWQQDVYYEIIEIDDQDNVISATQKLFDGITLQNGLLLYISVCQMHFKKKILIMNT